MIIVSDTSPLISLIKIRRLDLLKDMFGTVLIPPAVYRELTAFPQFADEAEIIERSPFIKVVEARDVDLMRSLSTELDIGETEAIALAIESSAALLMIDEARGRSVAKRIGIPITGTVGILIHACEDRLLNKDDVDSIVADLKRSRRYIDGRLLDKLISVAKSFSEDHGEMR